MLERREARLERRILGASAGLDQIDPGGARERIIIEEDHVYDLKDVRTMLVKLAEEIDEIEASCGQPPSAEEILDRAIDEVDQMINGRRQTDAQSRQGPR